MADITNKQLGEIIAAAAEKIQTNVLKERKIATDLEKISIKFQESIGEVGEKINALESTVLKPDLSEINKFYTEKTEENIKRLNSRINVPNFVFYVWVASAVLFLCSGLFLWYSVKSKQDIITDYRKDLQKDYRIISNEDSKLFEDMNVFFQKNPKTKEIFIKFRENKETK